MHRFISLFALAATLAFGALEPGAARADDDGGVYLGRLGGSPYSLDSTANPYGRYGSPFSPISIHNSYGRWGSPYSPQGVTNPYTTQGPSLVAPDTGQFLGHLNSNRFDSDSVANPFGRYGSPSSPVSINNPFGRYGSPFSPTSPTNPFAVDTPILQGE